MISLKEKYRKEVIPAMMEKFEYKNRMAVPKIEKVVVNIGFGRVVVEKTSKERKKFSEAILDDISLIVGQRPVLTKARKSISGFKTRQGMPIGAKVVLRRKRMSGFISLQKLFSNSINASKALLVIPSTFPYTYVDHQYLSNRIIFPCCIAGISLSWL